MPKVEKFLILDPDESEDIRDVRTVTEAVVLARNFFEPDEDKPLKIIMGGGRSPISVEQLTAARDTVQRVALRILAIQPGETNLPADLRGQCATNLSDAFIILKKWLSLFDEGVIRIMNEPDGRVKADPKPEPPPSGKYLFIGGRADGEIRDVREDFAAISLQFGGFSEPLEMQFDRYERRTLKADSGIYYVFIYDRLSDDEAVRKLRDECRFRNAKLKL